MDDVIAQELDEAKIAFARIGLRQYTDFGFSITKSTTELNRWHSQFSDRAAKLEDISTSTREAFEKLRSEIGTFLPDPLCDLGRGLSIT